MREIHARRKYSYSLMRISCFGKLVSQYKLRYLLHKIEKHYHSIYFIVCHSALSYQF
jgi:hypothetical protein